MSHTVILCSYSMVLGHPTSLLCTQATQHILASIRHTPTYMFFPLNLTLELRVSLAHDALKCHSKIIYFFNFRPSPS